jgi:hypothetical protein
MATRALTIGTALLTLAAVGGCASSKPAATRAVKVAGSAPSGGPVLLAQFGGGVGAVSASSPAPLWLEAGAVSAFDGSAVFSIRKGDPGGADQLVRIDTMSGDVAATWPLPSGVASISAVAPGGRWIALTNREPGYASQGRVGTELVVFNPSTGSETYRRTLSGDVQPEAFSADGTMIFALNHFVDHYRVQTLYLKTGERYDTSDRDKTLPPEDMHGQAVHGVMSKDRTLLATLYRNPGNKTEPAFVHVLDLQHGWSYCADLPAPFGTNPTGSDQIELTPRDTVVVAATRALRLAEIRIDAVLTPGNDPVPIAFRNGTITPLGAAYQSIPGFDYAITKLAA